ncbi:MAG: trimethylamine methyltransferase family protein [Pseudomonadota bacterium]
MQPNRAKRSGGRRAKQAQRAAAGVNPSPPGQPGGRYAPLRPAEVEAIFATALRLLDELGMGEVPGRLADDLIALGARRGPDDRLRLPPALIHDAIDRAARAFPLHGRDPARSIQVGGDRVHFGTGGAAVQTLDLASGLYRPSTLQDLHDFTRLQDTLDNVSWFTRCCIATDVADPFELDVNTAYALIRNTTKPVATAFTLAEHVAPIVRMLDIAGGGDGAFAARPFLKAHVSPVISPLRFGEDAVDVVYACIEAGVPLSCITAAQSGATAPATLAGFLAQSLAETLASLAMVHAVRPGFPMVFSNWPLVIDLRTGAFAGGGGEIAVLNAASAQISNHLGLPSGVAASMTDAKAIDAQYGAEKALTALAAGLAGGNLVYESSGMTASLLGASFEAFVLDNEMHAAIYRALRGIEVDEASLAFDAIVEAVRGEGHFLGSPATYAAMERDYVYPDLADRATPQAWAEAGAQDAWTRARARARKILAEHRPAYLDPDRQARLHREFPLRAAY